MSRATRRAFADRASAGRALAVGLAGEAGPRTVVAGLARGGVPVAAPVAAALGAPLDAVVVRKVGHPLRPELALGAVTSDGNLALPPPGQRAGVPDAASVAAARDAARRIEARLRAGRRAVPLDGATCVLVDDGLATGASMRAAVAWARARGAAHVVVAAPVSSVTAADALRAEADRVECVLESDALSSVGEWYDDFGQVGEDEVAALLSDPTTEV
jgi:putative phosphoribosyl transferase